MEHILSFEKFNVQDMMDIPTSIRRSNYLKDNSKHTKTLEPYYNYIKNINGIKELTDITYEEIDNLVGFSFIVNYNKIMILSDEENVHILINKELIPLDTPEEIVKIINSEI